MNDRRSKPITSKLSRRDFLGAALVAASGLPTAQTESHTILDFHQHANYLGRNDQQLIAHQDHHHLTTTVLLPGDGWMLTIPVGDNAMCAGLVKQYPDRFLRFACCDAAECLWSLARTISGDGIGRGGQRRSSRIRNLRPCRAGLPCSRGSRRGRRAQSARRIASS